MDEHGPMWDGETDRTVVLLWRAAGRLGGETVIDKYVSWISSGCNVDELHKPHRASF